MPNGNNNRPIEFPAVPILGQAFDVGQFIVTAILICRCDGEGNALLITSAGPTACAACGKAYLIQGLTLLPGQAPNFKIGMALTRPATAAEGVRS